MPDEAKPNQLEQIENNSENNAEVAAKLLNQDNLGKPSSSDELAHTTDALDALVAKKGEEKKAELETPKPDEKPAPATPKPDEKPVAKTEPKSDEKPVTPAPDPTAEAHKKRADELFKDSPSLPANASPKSNEAFSSVKLKAAQEISALEATVEKQKKEIADFQAKLKNPVPEEVTRELNDHRQWRAKLDVETDPKFKEFDKKVSEAQEFIYSQLRKSPAITPEVIEKIKSYGGPENVNLEKIFESMKDPTIQRMVESKVADIEMAKFGKEQAIKSTKENISQYLTERQKQWEESATAHNTATQTQLDQLTGKLEWLKEKPDDAEHNKFVAEVQGHIKNGLQDDSPEMRAIMLAGMAQLLYLQRVHEGAKSNLESERKSHEETKKLLTEATAKLDKFKNASVSRLRESAAPPGGRLPEAKKDVDFRPASQALDDIAKQVVEERQRTANVG